MERRSTFVKLLPIYICVLGLVFDFIPSHVNGQGYKTGPTCVSVCPSVSALMAWLCNFKLWDVMIARKLKSHEKSSYIITFHQNSHQVHVSKCCEKSLNLTWLHFMTYDNIWWHFMTKHVVYHDISWQIIKWLSLIQRGTLYRSCKAKLPSESEFKLRLKFNCNSA